MYPSLPALLSSLQQRPPGDATPTVIVLPRRLGPPAIHRALQHQQPSQPGSGGGNEANAAAEGATALAPAPLWWQVLMCVALAPPVLVFYEGVGEGLLTACRLWRGDGHPVPSGDARAWAAGLWRYQLHAGGEGGRTLGGDGEGKEGMRKGGKAGKRGGAGCCPVGRGLWGSCCLAERVGLRRTGRWNAFPTYINAGGLRFVPAPLGRTIL